MDKTCQKCEELNPESASFCTQCGHDLSVVVVPTGIQLVSYFYLFGAAQCVVMMTVRWGFVSKMAEGYFSATAILTYLIVTTCINLYIWFYLKKLSIIAFYVFFVVSVLSLFSSGIMLANINPFLQRMYEVMNLTPRIAEQDFMEMFMILAVLAGMAVNMIVAGYIFTKRKLFTK
jgi:hypothetical protein